MLPADITSSDELDDLFSTFGSAGIEVVDSEKTYREEKLLDRTGEGAEEIELDLTPGALDKTNDPVRMYLREMGTVPLLTREGEVEIAKRIERGKLAVIKSISRTAIIAARHHADGRRAQDRRAQRARAGDLQRRRDHRREDRAPQEADPQADRRRQPGLAGGREGEGEARQDRPRHDDPRQEEVPARALGVAARPRPALAADPQDRVHRSSQAPPDRPDQGRRRVGHAPQARDRPHRAAGEPEDRPEEPAEGRGEEDPPQAPEGPQGADEDDGRATSKRRPTA